MNVRTSATLDKSAQSLHTSAAMVLAVSSGTNEGVIWLIASAVALYGAARLALFGLARPDGSDPGRRAIGQWVPIAAPAIGAIIMHQPEVAISIILGTSVAALSLVPGLVTFMTPIEAPATGRRLWPFVLPAAMLPLMAGFTGHLSWGHALMMLLLGAVLMLLWHEEYAGKEGETSQTTDNPVVQKQDTAYSALLLFIGILLAVGGSWLGVRGTYYAAMESRFLSPGLVAVVIFSPLLLLPTIGTASAVAQHGHVGNAMSALIGTVLLNLCLLLPATILLYGLQNSSLKPPDNGTSIFFFQRVVFPPLAYPFGAWRVDTVVLVVLGFAWVPVAMGRWKVGRLESALLIIGFLIYLVAQSLLVMPFGSHS